MQAEGMQAVSALVTSDLKSRVFNAAHRDGFVGRSFQSDWIRRVLNSAVEASERGKPLVMP